MLIDRLEEFERLAQEIEYGRIEDVTFDLEDRDLMGLPTKEPMRKFLKMLRDRNGSATFSVLKIQFGLPMYGEVEIQEGAIQSHKFS